MTIQVVIFQMRDISWAGGGCVNHCNHFIFELCKNMKVQSIEVLLIDNRKSSQGPHNGGTEN